MFAFFAGALFFDEQLEGLDVLRLEGVVQGIILQTDAPLDEHGGDLLGVADQFLQEGEVLGQDGSDGPLAVDVVRHLGYLLLVPG